MFALKSPALPRRPGVAEASSEAQAAMRRRRIGIKLNPL